MLSQELSQRLGIGLARLRRHAELRQRSPGFRRCPAHLFLNSRVLNQRVAEGRQVSIGPAQRPLRQLAHRRA